MRTINIADIRVNGGTQSRAQINRETVSEYAEAMESGSEFPPLVVFYDGSAYWLADGFHRYEAYARSNAHDVTADVRQGTQRDAILYGVGANASHGLRRTNDDKRRAVMVLLNDPEWSKWSARDIARQCGVSHDFAARLKREVSSDDSEPRDYTTKHGTHATMNTANIGRRNDEGTCLAEEQRRREVAEGERLLRAAYNVEAEEVPPETAKQRREIGKLTTEAMIDEIIGLKSALAEQKAKVSDLKSENAKLKEQLKGHTGDKDETIRRMTKAIEHKSSEMYRANEKFDVEKRKNYALAKRVKELEAMEIQL